MSPQEAHDRALAELRAQQEEASRASTAHHARALADAVEAEQAKAAAAVEAAVAAERARGEEGQGEAAAALAQAQEEVTVQKLHIEMLQEQLKSTEGEVRASKAGCRVALQGRG